MRFLSSLRLLLGIVRELGFSWLAYRAAYSLEKHSILPHLKSPTISWGEQPLATWLCPGLSSNPADYVGWRKEQPTHFFFVNLEPIPANLFMMQNNIKEHVDALIAGQWDYFGTSQYEIGFPPKWHYNPFSKEVMTDNRHWSKINEFGGADIKFLWEPNRFGATYLLVRAYSAYQDAAYAEAFWKLVQNWANNNPPNRGPNWKCGQEATFRVMAWCFGLYAFASLPCSEPEQIANLVAMIAVHAARIESNISYARSQKNNHAISEAVGLWTVGVLFPEFKRAEHWQTVGKRVLEVELQRQIYDDGAYIQHSTNYHRLMLHDCVWAMQLAELNGLRFNELIYDRVAKAVEFLYQLIDPETGHVPNCGANDGALILPLNSCDYSDFRPVLQAAYYLLHRTHLFPEGPWDEDLYWLFGPNAVNRSTTARVEPKPLINLSADQGGYYTIRSAESWAMIRCAAYKDRPSHADQLHLDIWWRGINVASDGGSYLYNAPSPWNNGLAITEVHNTVTVDGRDQMTRLSRFLWLDWAQGKLRQELVISPNRYLKYWEGEHFGYKRLAQPVKHSRAVLHLCREYWLVLDELISESEHDFRLHWLMPDIRYVLHKDGLALDTNIGEYQVRVGVVDGQGNFSVVRADGNSVRGWRSLYYSHKEPALSVALNHSNKSTQFWSVLGPAGFEVDVNQRSIQIKTHDWLAEIELNFTTDKPLIRSAHLRGALKDHLVI